MKSVNINEIGEICSTKLSRRDFVKVTGASALFLAMPNLAISSMEEKFEPPKSENIGGGEPSVILQKNKELKGFRGFDERILRDNELIERFSKENPTVILANGDKVIEYRGLEEYILEDNDLRDKISSKFDSKTEVEYVIA